MKVKLLVVLGICFLAGIGFAFLLARPIAPPPANVPNPNGYDTLMSAAQQMSLVPPDFYESTDTVALTRCLDENQATLALLDEALAQDYVIPPASLAAAVESPEEVGQIRNLSRVLVVQARVAEMEGRLDDAADALAKVILLGDRYDRGGLLIHSLTGIAVEGSGIEMLTQLAPKLTPEKKTELLSMLQKSLEVQPNFANELDQIMDREQDQMQQRMGRVAAFFSGWQTSGTTEPAKQAARSAMERNQKQLFTLFEALRSPDPS